jgi:hypothetical protein
MTPVGFPLARYSHHAPREGQSLSTAGSRPLQSEGAHDHDSLEGGLTTMTVRGASHPRPWLIPVATGNHERRALRNWWSHVHRDLGAATTVAHPCALKLILFVLHSRSTNENASEPAQRLADMEVEQVSPKETHHGCCCCCCLLLEN